MKRARAYVLAASLLAGTIIGAGIFSLPYVFTRAGLLLGFFYLAIAAFSFVVVHLCYGEVVARDNAKHRFVGYARMYLGNVPSILALWMTVFQMLLVLAIYIVLSVSFLRFVFPSLPQLYSALLFWGAGSLAIFLTLRRVAIVEFLITGGIIGIIAVIFFLAVYAGGRSSISAVTWEYAAFPLAPLLFSLAGRPAIPSLLQYCRMVNYGGISMRFLRRTIFWGTVIPAVVYAFFVLGVIGLSHEVSHDAVSGLIGAVHSGVLFAIGILGILSLWSSYLVIGLDIKQILEYDLRFSKFSRALAVVAVPLFIYFISGQNFLRLIGIAGGLFLALEGIFILLIWRKARQSREGNSVILIPRAATMLAVASGAVFVIVFITEAMSIMGVLPSP